MRLVGTGGTIVVAGVEPPGRFEWTPLYFKELRVVGAITRAVWCHSTSRS